MVVATVRFAPGARTAAGQYLRIISGIGRFGTRDGKHPLLSGAPAGRPHGGVGAGEVEQVAL